MKFIKTKSYPDIFEVSQCGQVRSVRSGKVYKQHKHQNGYMTIATYIGGRFGKSLCIKVHRMVGEIFCDNPNNHPIIHHIDNNKINNNSSNLRWVSYSENSQMAHADGLITIHRGEDSKSSKLTEKTIRLAKKMVIPYSREFGVRSIAKTLGVDHGTLSNALSGKTWSHLNL